ncbi:hypothetical protein HQ520_07630 [bacterium]|nr:hypothetical protein [bacterium]
MHRLSPDGRVKWAFPADGPAAMTFLYLDADPTGRRVAILTGEETSGLAPDPPLQSGALCVLDGATGRMLDLHIFEPLRPYFDRVLFWQSVSVGHDGRRAAIGLHDGRSFIFDLEDLAVAHAFDFGAPIRIGGIPVSAGATYTKVAPVSVCYFQTGNSSVPSGAAAEQRAVAPPGPHPRANAIHAVGPDGQVLWRFRSGHHYQNFWTSADGRWMLTSVQKHASETAGDSGAMLFDTRRTGGGSDRFVYYYQTEGLSLFQAGICPDGSAVAIVETPFQNNDRRRVQGDYQVHIVR